MADSAATAVSATTARGDTVRETNTKGMETSGVVSAATGMNRPRMPAMATALAAMAPEKPATNEVHPVRNAAMGPYASRRYTYSPPA